MQRPNPTEDFLTATITLLCLQAFKEMLYAAQDQAPSIEGTTCIHMHIRAHANTPHYELIEAAVVLLVISTCSVIEKSWDHS